jgi:hypothetical protein
MTLESQVRLTVHAWFGGGPSEKALISRDLVGGLPDVTPGSVGAGG